MSDIGRQIRKMWQNTLRIHKKSIVQEVVSKIKKVVLDGCLKPGDRLPSEIELAKSFSVSRSAVREAMKVLQTQGIMQVKRGEGTFIAQDLLTTIALDPLVFSLILGYRTPEELLELREMLEAGILGIVMKKATDQDLQKMEQTIQIFETDSKKATADPQTLCQDDLAFHYAFAEATRNPLIIKIAGAIWEMFAPSIQKGFEQGDLTETPREHRSILKAIEEKDFDKAKQAIHKALESWKRGGYTVLRKQTAKK